MKGAIDVRCGTEQRQLPTQVGRRDVRWTPPPAMPTVRCPRSPAVGFPGSLRSDLRQLLALSWYGDAAVDEERRAQRRPGNRTRGRSGAFGRCDPIEQHNGSPSGLQDVLWRITEAEAALPLRTALANAMRPWTACVRACVRAGSPVPSPLRTALGSCLSEPATRRSSWIFGRTRHRVARSASCPGTSCPNTDIRRCVRGCLAGSRSLERQRWRHGRQQRPPERFEIVHAQCPLRGRQVVGP